MDPGAPSQNNLEFEAQYGKAEWHRYHSQGPHGFAVAAEKCLRRVSGGETKVAPREPLVL
jgi:hypothetical protein